MRRLDQMPTYFKWLSNFNYLRFSLQSTIINSYGMGRCAETSVGVNVTTFMDFVPDEKMLEIYASDKINVDLLVGVIDSVMNGIIDAEHSIIMIASNLRDSDLYWAIPIMIMHIVFYRWVTYMVITKRIQSKS